MGLMEARMANRMGTRQMYRTANRMERRRARYMGPQYAMGGGREQVQQEQYEQQAQYAQPQAPAPASEPTPAYVEELRQLAELQQQGVITQDEFDAKRKQLLGLS
jgi:hypothetical protein